MQSRSPTYEQVYQAIRFSESAIKKKSGHLQSKFVSNKKDVSTASLDDIDQASLIIGSMKVLDNKIKEPICH